MRLSVHGLSKPLVANSIVALLHAIVPVGASSIDIRSKAADLQNELGEVGHRWYELGILLGLPVHTLDGFQDSYAMPMA